MMRKPTIESRGIGLLLVLLMPGAWGYAGSPPMHEHAPSAQPAPRIIADFRAGVGTEGWQIEDDGVMGGVSQGTFTTNLATPAVFAGEVSLANNGGFSSVQHPLAPMKVSAYRTARLKVKGDGKRYQFIVESEPQQRHYYTYEFQTGNDWQVIRIPLAEMIPVFRGTRLNQPNYPAQSMSMVRFLIANNKAETFRLEIEAIWLE